MTAPTVGAYVKVPADCDITYSFEVGEDVNVLLGTARVGFEIIFERAALERFVGVGEKALRAHAGRDHGQAALVRGAVA
jgi:hypothetical protein